MELLFMPLACSLATRISLDEAGAPAEYVEIDPITKRTLDGGRSLFDDNPLGLVPTLRTDDGAILTENAAVLQWVAERWPEARLMPEDPMGKTRLRAWLCFLGTELHKGVFSVLFDKKAPDAAKAYVVEKAKAPLEHLEQHLRSNTFLLGDAFSVADAYLITILNWTLATPIDLGPYPALSEYAKRLRKRPSVARAIAIERELYAKELERHAHAAKG
jgi:glutathione S-transferase